MTVKQRTTSGLTAALVAVLAIGALGLVPAPSAAQSGLEAVERLTRMGRTDEARAALLDWWDDGRSDASRRELQRGLWLRGRLTVDPVQAELDFQRLALLYPSGQFTPDAVLRLAQASWAMGDEPAARRHLDTLERDYRRSDAWERAQDWIADAGPLPPPGDTPLRTVDPVEEAVEPNATPERPTRDSTVVQREADDPEEIVVEDDTATDEPAMNYYVQLGAFADEERAIALYEEVRGQDIDVRVVEVVGSQFTHVRVGRFAARAAAVELLEELTAQGISAALVRDDREERPAGN
jgi:cell division septation protein DedD